MPFLATKARAVKNIVVQIPESFQTVWDWSEWQYNPANGQITSKTASDQLIPYNYMVFSISVCE